MDRSEQVAQVIAHIEQGDSERSACEKVGINRGTFRSAALRHEAADHYAKALSALAHEQVNLVEAAIDDMRSGVIDAQMARVEIDTRKWFASKFLPKKYGDKLQTEHSGAVGVISHEQWLDSLK